MNRALFGNGIKYSQLMVDHGKVLMVKQAGKAQAGAARKAHIFWGWYRKNFYSWNFVICWCVVAWNKFATKYKKNTMGYQKYFTSVSSIILLNAKEGYHKIFGFFLCQKFWTW